MKGMTINRVGEFYVVSFETYDHLIKYLNIRRPSQVSVLWDGETLTASFPVTAKTVKHGDSKIERTE